MRTDECPICDSSSQLDQIDLNIYEIRCSRCGDYSINSSAKHDIKRAFELDNKDIDQYLSMGEAADNPPVNRLYIEVAKKAADGRGVGVARSIISHALRKRIDKGATLTWEVLANVLKNNSLPTPAELANNSVSLLGGSLSSPSANFPLNPPQENVYSLLGFKIGADELKDLRFIVRSLEKQQVIDVAHNTGGNTLSKTPIYALLTLDGWQKYEELQRSVEDSRKSFVAMEFPSSERTTANYFF
jgi:hypothetical protein